MPVSAVLFDAYGTLFDVYSVARCAESWFPGSGERLAALWREKQIEYTRLVTLGGHDGEHYQPFWALTRAGLRWAALRLQLALSTAAEDQLMQEYLQLRPFSEVLDVLTELQARSVPAGILSNGDPKMLHAVVRHAGFDSLLQHVLSVDSVRRFKTHPAAYALGPLAMGLPVADILFVSSNGWDAISATWYGYTTLWVNRAGLPLELLGTEPSFMGNSLADVLAHLPPR